MLCCCCDPSTTYPERAQLDVTALNQLYDLMFLPIPFYLKLHVLCQVLQEQLLGQLLNAEDQKQGRNMPGIRQQRGGIGLGKVLSAATFLLMLISAPLLAATTTNPTSSAAVTAVNGTGEVQVGDYAQYLANGGSATVRAAQQLDRAAGGAHLRQHRHLCSAPRPLPICQINRTGPFSVNTSYY